MTRQTLAALLFRHLCRLGLVLGPADLDVPTGAAPAADDAGGADDAGDEGEGEDEGNPTDPNAPQAKKGDAPQDERDKLIRKLERRIDRRSAAIGGRDAEIAALRAQLAQAKAQPAGDDNDEDGGDDADDHSKPTRGKVDPEKRARELASEMLDQQSVATRTRAMVEAGAKLDPKWREVAAEVAAELPFVDAQKRPTPFIRAVLAAPDPAALLHHIGTHDEVLDSLHGLDAAALGFRLGELSATLKKAPAAPRRSNAPTPHEPVSGRGNTQRDEAAMNDDEWRESRRAQRK